jgi:FlgD Ig-like domain
VTTTRAGLFIRPLTIHTCVCYQSPADLDFVESRGPAFAEFMTRAADRICSGRRNPMKSVSPIAFGLCLLVSVCSTANARRSGHDLRDREPTSPPPARQVRADMANDVAPGTHTNSIIPGDSAVVKVADPEAGLGIDPTYGQAAVYCYVSVWPQGQAAKSGAALTQNPARYPVVGSWTDASGVPWTCVRLDSSIVNGVAQPDFYCVDLNDNLFTPGDTVCFFYCAKNTNGVETYALGSNLTAHGADREQAAANPSEFTCLPAGGWRHGGDILYVDGMDGRGAQPYWDTAMQSIGILKGVDRYDVRGPSSGVSNRPAGRVKNFQVQLLNCYRIILWDCGDLDIGLGDGSGTPEKTDDYQLLDDFLSNLTNPGGVYLSGDDVGQVLAGYAGTSAVTFRTNYLTYNLTAGSHRTQFGISPTGVHRNGGCYRDDFIIYGGCPLLNDFDVMEPTGSATIEVGYGTPATTNGAVIAQVSTNGNNTRIGVVLSGFSFIYIHDDEANGVLDRAKFLYDTIVWMGDLPNLPTAAGPLAVNSLSQNYPNPFNPQTTIAFSLKERRAVTLTIYNVAGQRVRTLASESFAAGAHTRVWDGRNDAGQPVSSGVYFYKLVAKDFVQTRKMVLLK